VIPNSADAFGTVLEAKAKGKMKGEARLKLALLKITIKGKKLSDRNEEVATHRKGKGQPNGSHKQEVVLREAA